MSGTNLSEGLKSKSSIVFKKLVVDAFLSYDHEELYLDNLGVVSVRGRNDSDGKSESNGSGKSALISESLVWGLTGYTTRGTKQVSNMYLADGRGASVVIEFMLDGNEYIVTRGVTKSLYGNSISVVKNGVELNPEKKVTSGNAVIIGEFEGKLDWKRLTSIIVMSQGMNQALSVQTTANRKDQLEQLANVADTYDSVSSLVKLVESRHQAKVTEVITNIRVSDSKIAQYESSLASLNIKLTEAINRNNSVRPDEAVINNAIQVEVDAIALNTSKFDKTNEDYDKLSADVKTHLATQQEVNMRLNSLSSSLVDPSTRSRTNTSLVSQLKVTLATDQGKLAMLKDNFCPTCGQLMNAEDVEKHRLELTASIESLQSRIDSATAEITKANAEVAKIEKSIQGMNSEVESARSSVANAQSKIQELEVSRRELTSDTSSRNLVINSLKSQLNFQASDTEIFRTQIQEVTNQLSSEKLVRSPMDVELIDSEEDLRLSKWLSGQTSRSIRSYLLTGVINYLNSRCLEYSTYLFENSVVKFVIDNSNIDIMLDDKLVESISGGERRRLDMIVQLSLRDLVLVDSGVNSNLLVIDEALDYLDAPGVNSVLDLLIYQVELVSSVMIITHKSDADIPYNNLLEVVKSSDNISRVVR